MHLVAIVAMTSPELTDAVEVEHRGMNRHRHHCCARTPPERL
jgi:hypothetical protein